MQLNRIDRICTNYVFSSTTVTYPYHHHHLSLLSGSTGQSILELLSLIQS